MEDSKERNCADCLHFTSNGYRNWGYCDAPIPNYVKDSNNIVWIAGFEHIAINYAVDCEMYDYKYKE